MATLAKKTKIILLLLGIIGIISLTRTALLNWNSYLLDFSVFYYATQSVLQHTNPYTNPHLFTPANYPPVTFLFIIPFALFPISIAAKSWILTSLICFFFSMWILYKTKPISIYALIILFVGAVFAFPFKFTLGMGQINLFVLLVLCLVFYWYNKKEIPTAIAFTLAIALKLFPIGLIIDFIIRRKYKVILVTSIIIFLLFFLSLFFFSVQTYIYYWQYIVLGTLIKSADGVYYNQSITGIFARLHISQIFLQVTRIFFIIITVTILIKRKVHYFLSFSILLTLILLINNFTWQHHLILLLIPYYVLLFQKLSRQEILLIFLSYILIAFNFKNPHTLENQFIGRVILSHDFWGMLMLWFILLFHKEEKKEVKQRSL